MLLGAYLFGGVTMLQFHLQGQGVQIASQFLSMLPYLATIVVLALISRNPAWIRINMPASLGKPFHPALDRTRTPTRRNPMFSPRQAFLVEAPRCSPRWPCSRPAARKSRLRPRPPRRRPAPRPAPAREPFKVAWMYVGPVGDAGWTLAHDLGRQRGRGRVRRQVKTSFVEKVPEGADAERVIRDLAAQGNKLIFATSFGFMEPMLKVASEFPDVKFEHATGYKTAPNLRIYDAKLLRGRVPRRRHRRAGDQDQHARLRRLVPDPGGAAQHQRVHARRAERQPEDQDAVVWVNSWFDPPKESEAAQSLINRRRRRAAAEHRLDRSPADGGEERQVRVRLGQRHEHLRAQGSPRLGVVDWGSYYEKAVKEAMDGTWKTDRTVWGVKEGQNDLVKIADSVPDEAKKRSPGSRRP